MYTANIHEAKTHLSQLLKMTSQGEDVVICKGNKPVAMLVPYIAKQPPRQLGLFEGQIWIADDFDELPEEFKDYL